MRGYVPGFEIATPSTLDEALSLLAEAPGRYKPLAGGTDVMVYLESGGLPPSDWLSLWQLDELRGIEVTDTHVTLGALTTYMDVREADICRAEFPMLVAAARASGAIAIQNRGTLGGNVMNASPAADSPPALLAYDAEVELVRAGGGSRWVAYADLHTGYKQLAAADDELLRAIRLPRRSREARWTHFYWKVGTRAYQAISKVCMAAIARWDDGVVRDVRIGVGSVAPTVLKAARTEAAIEGQANVAALDDAAAAAMRADVAPIDDIRSTARYRQQVAANLARAFLQVIRHEHGGGEKPRLPSMDD